MDVEEVSVNSHEHKAFTLKGWDTLVAWGPIIRRVSFDAHSTHQMYFRQKQSSGVSAGKKHRDVYWCSTASTCSEAARRQQRVTQTHGRQWTSERRFKSPSGATWGPEVSRTQTPCDMRERQPADNQSWWRRAVSSWAVGSDSTTWKH